MRRIILVMLMFVSILASGCEKKIESSSQALEEKIGQMIQEWMGSRNGWVPGTFMAKTSGWVPGTFMAKTSTSLATSVHFTASQNT